MTALECLKLCGSMRLADIVYQLKNEGHHIETEMIKVGNNRKKVALYWMPLYLKRTLTVTRNKPKK